MDNQGNNSPTIPSSYIVSVSQSKRYLFAYQFIINAEGVKEDFVNVIDIQNERVLAKLKVS